MSYNHGMKEDPDRGPALLPDGDLIQEAATCTASTLLRGPVVTARLLVSAETTSTVEIPADPTKFAYLIGIAGMAKISTSQGCFLAGSGDLVLIDRSMGTSVMFGRTVNEWLLFEGCKPPTKPEAMTRHTGTRRLGDANDAIFAGLLKRTVTASIDQDPAAENLVLCLVSYAAVIGSSPDAIRLATVPRGCSGSFQAMLESVVENPTANWSLLQAGATSAYSPFHLSRTFRSHAPYGFPEFVERLRTELVVSRLLGGNGQLAEIAKSCGFGSVPAMRAALREYTGFLPSELRGVDGNRAVVKD